MRLLHTSDWHLGRRFGQASLADDQAAFVGWLLDVVRAEAVDLVVVAGDLYDRPIPPVESVGLLGDALRALADQRVQVVAVAGNHDSPDRVAAADGLTDASGVIVRGGYGRAGETITMEFADGPLDIVALPYLDPQMAPDQAIGAHRVEADQIDRGGAPSRPTHQSVLKAAVANHRARATRSVAIAHAFVAGGHESESERVLTVGGSPRVATTTFAPFDYVALGHLHMPQTVAGDATRRYSGSPLPYSFSETHAKQVVLVDIDANGACVTREIPIDVGRSVATVTGEFDDLLSSTRHAAAERSFVRAVVTDTHHVVDAKARLLRRFPFVTEVVLAPPPDAGDTGGATAAQRSRLDPLDAATAFWTDVTGRALSGPERRLLTDVLDRANSLETVS